MRAREIAQDKKRTRHGVRTTFKVKTTTVAEYERVNEVVTIVRGKV